MPTTTSASRIDVREIAPRDRHPIIFQAFRSLGPSRTIEIVNDHDPKPLYCQMQAEQPGQFAWESLESGPDVWRVRITKFAGGHGNGQCCGACGGA